MLGVGFEHGGIALERARSRLPGAHFPRSANGYGENPVAPGVNAVLSWRPAVGQRVRPGAATARMGAAVLGLALPLLAANPAWSQSAADTAKAEALFREARTALARGDHATACPKLGESLRLARRASTLFNLAECEAAKGQLVAALERWQEGIALLDAKDNRVADARDRAAAIDKRVPRLRLQLAPEVPGEARVEIDGAEIAHDRLGALVPVNPGEHVLTLTAPGRREQRVPVTLAEGERKEVTLAFPPSAPDKAGQPGTRPGTAAWAPPSMATDQAPSSGRATRRAIGFVVGGVGVAGLGVGIATGLMTIGKKNDVDDACDRAQCTTTATQDAADSGKTLSTISTLTFVGGAVGIGVGAVLVVTSLSGGGPQRAGSAALAPMWLPGGAGVCFGGAL